MSVNSEVAAANGLFRNTDSETGTDTNTAIANAATGIMLFLHNVSVANKGTTDTEVIIMSATTEIWRLTAPAGSGSNMAWPTNAPLALVAAEALAWKCADAVAGGVYVSVSGRVGPAIPVVTA